MAASEQTIVVVSDSVGFVGAFASVDEAQTTLRPYLGVPLVYCGWRRRAVEAAPASKDAEAEDLVWILPYKANNAVACASNVQAVVETAQQNLLRLGLVYDDNVKYWEAVVGVVSRPAQIRLNALVAAASTPPPGPADEKKDTETVSNFLAFACEGACEIASRHDEKEPKRIDLLESVVPRALDAPSPAFPQA